MDIKNKTAWSWSVDSKSGEQTLVVPKKRGFSFGELMTVQIAAADFLQTVQHLILAQVTGKDPSGKPLPSRQKKGRS